MAAPNHPCHTHDPSFAVKFARGALGQHALPFPLAKRLTPSRLSLNSASGQFMKTRHSIIPLLGLAAALVAAGCTTPRLAQQKRVVYGERNEHELTYEFLQPRKTNGLGVVVMVSGAWRSNPDDFKPMMGKAFLRRGYSMFAVSHLSQPKAPCNTSASTPMSTASTPANSASSGPAPAVT